MAKISENKYNKLLEDRYKNEGLQLKITPNILGLFCEYVLSNNASIHRSGLVNLRNLLTIIDPTKSFENNPNLIDRYNFCLDVLKAKLDKNLTEKEYIISDVKGVLGDKYNNLDINGIGEISTSNVLWVESEIIPNYLNASLINNSILDLQRECAKYVTADPKDIPQYIENIYKQIDKIYIQKRRNQIDADDADSMFQLSKFEDTTSAIWNNQKSTSYKLISGMQSLNHILGGGFEERRVYCFFGLPGDGKTITLLNLMYQIKKYNPKVQCKDPTKKPCIVLLTMENYINEEVQTLYNIAVSSEDISERPLDDVIKAIANSDLFKDPEGNPNPIDLFIKFKPINSVTTEYMYKLTEELNDDGYEVICMLQDYIMRIRSADSSYNAEERVKLGNIINEFKNYAMYYSIPVITASQLNREAAKNIDIFRSAGQYDDMVNKISRANIAESSQLDFNLDAIIFIAPCWEGEYKWLAFKLIKKRYKADILPEDTIFFQPFVIGMNAKLVEDVGRTMVGSRNSLNYDRKTNKAADLFENAVKTNEVKSEDDNLARFGMNAKLEKPIVDNNGRDNGFIGSKQEYDETTGNKVYICNVLSPEEIDELTYYEYLKEILNGNEKLIDMFEYYDIS